MKRIILFLVSLSIVGVSSVYATDLHNTTNNMYSLYVSTGAYIWRGDNTTFIFWNTGNLWSNFFGASGFFYWRAPFTMAIDNSVGKYYSSTWEYFCSYTRPVGYAFHFLTWPVAKYSICSPTAIYHYNWSDYTESLENFGALDGGGQPSISANGFVNQVWYGTLFNATGISSGKVGGFLYIALGAMFLLAIWGLILVFKKYIQ